MFYRNFNGALRNKKNGLPRLKLPGQRAFDLLNVEENAFKAFRFAFKTAFKSFLLMFLKRLY